MYYTEPDRLIASFANISSGLMAAFKRLNGRGMKRLLLVAGFLVLVGNILVGQAVGDYRSAVTGNWNIRATWGNVGMVLAGKFHHFFKVLLTTLQVLLRFKTGIQ